MTKQDIAQKEIPKKEVLSQKIDIRDFFRLSVCAKGLHIWIPPHLISNFNLERGDELYIRIEEVRYSNIREIPA